MQYKYYSTARIHSSLKKYVFVISHEIQKSQNV